MEDQSVTLFLSGVDLVKEFLNFKASYFGFELSNLEILIGGTVLFLISYFIFRILD